MTNSREAEWLRGLRHRYGLTQVEMSRLLGVTTGRVAAWEAGVNPRPLRLAYRLLELSNAPRYIKPTFKLSKDDDVWTWHVYDQRRMLLGSGFDVARLPAEQAARRFMREVRLQPFRMV